MLANVIRFFRPRTAMLADNVLTLERYFRARYFSRVRNAIEVQGLRGKYKARAINHMQKVWRKHLDRVPDYATVQDATREAIKFVDEQTAEQRAAQGWPWSPRSVA